MTCLNFQQPIYKVKGKLPPCLIWHNVRIGEECGQLQALAYCQEFHVSP